MGARLIHIVHRYMTHSIKEPSLSLENVQTISIRLKAGKAGGKRSDRYVQPMLSS